MNTKDKLLAEISNLISLYTAANLASYETGRAFESDSLMKYRACSEKDLAADNAFHEKLREIIAIIRDEC